MSNKPESPPALLERHPIWTASFDAAVKADVPFMLAARHADLVWQTHSDGLKELTSQFSKVAKQYRAMLHERTKPDGK